MEAVAALSSAIAEVRISVYCAVVRLRPERRAKGTSLERCMLIEIQQDGWLEDD